MSTIVMTGGTSGLGAIAAVRLTRSGSGLASGSGEARLILGARRPEAPGAARTEAVPLDLTSLDSVRAFAASVRSRLDGDAVDALVLNAGIVRPDATGRTADGFETTFAVNHLAHYLVVRLLLPDLADKATVVLTTSGTHDPATGAGLEPPRHAEAELLAHADRDPGLEPRPRKAGQQAYTASKLCTVLTARALAGHPDVRDRGATVVAYCPGQVFGTGLAHELALPMRVAWTLMGTPLGWPVRQLNGTLNSRPAAGAALADLVSEAARPPDGRIYAALRRGRLTWPDPSELARRDDLADALWADSARLVGLPA
jgi:NAD(P)-dependent dehydrogenase (short-subunit alcohol dehydrogenase family)